MRERSVQIVRRRRAKAINPTTLNVHISVGLGSGTCMWSDGPCRIRPLAASINMIEVESEWVTTQVD